MKLNFTKMHGLGNDFIVFEAPYPEAVPSVAQLQALANRHTGVGFDQALVVQAARRPGTDLFYRIFNADGSEVEQCGNGARCVAQWLALRDGKAVRLNLIRMDSQGGLVQAQLLDDGQVAIDMGEPNFQPQSLPFDAAVVADEYALQVAGEVIKIGAVSMGNPHAVIQVSDSASAPVIQLGAAIEQHVRFPKRVNVGFMEILNSQHIKLRVFERGVGETQACGTGACAAVAVGRKQKLLAESVQVDLPGGRLLIKWPGPGHALWMIGPAVKVFEGQIEIA